MALEQPETYHYLTNEENGNLDGALPRLARSSSDGRGQEEIQCEHAEMLWKLWLPAPSVAGTPFLLAALGKEQGV